MKIVVTGGSGYLGTHVTNYFNAEDFSRRAGIDICKDEDAQAISDYDVVIHMAALVDKRPEIANRAFSVNVGGTLKLLENLRADQTFIFCSTKDVYGNNIDSYQTVPESCSTDYCGQGAYEWSKLIAEKYVQFYAVRANARAAIFRLSTVYGRASETNVGGFVSFFARAIAKGEELKLKMRGEQKRDLLHVDDLSLAFEKFIKSDRKFGLYNIGGGTANSTTLVQLAHTIGKMVGKPAQLSLSDELVKEQVHYITDLNLITEQLNWLPEIDIESGLKKIIL